jgi:ribosomal protein S18 acetylase RimI-like enzyme
MNVELRPASTLPRADLAALFTRTYEGYYVPVQVDEAALDFVRRVFDLDLDAGLVAFDDGGPVGLVNLGVRGERGWIGGLGVVAEARRRGLGRRLMEAVHERARELGIREIGLEVIEANDAAFRLYEDLGYEFTRWLELGSLPSVEGDPPAETNWEPAHAFIREQRTAPEPWQRDDDTLRHYDDLRAIRTESGAAVFRVSGDGTVVLMQLGGDVAAARELLGALRTIGNVGLLNIPEGDPVASAFRELGGEVRFRQRELALLLQ